MTVVPSQTPGSGSDAPEPGGTGSGVLKADGPAPDPGASGGVPSAPGSPQLRGPAPNRRTAGLAPAGPRTGRPHSDGG
ncbi:hypothetical protein ABZ759_26185, partial [Streptomyces sp. NPDC047860]